MNEPVIRVEHLSKQYRIGSRQAPYKTLRESLMSLATAPMKRLRNPQASGNGSETIWALKDVSFDVGQGEVLGIIGRNGAGKSTLLKILAHITRPTSGQVRLRGRVGSLLEVGTGFHPELTGRENIYLNGAILGMQRVEIRRKFDEIVDFAETEQFLDTPVKHYSSGMYTRLAFAVAAYLEPEILLVDEVLAVGDIAFQQKCLGKMGKVAQEGRTIVFVSHNMAAVVSLCKKCFLLERGIIKLTGNVDEVTNYYVMNLNFTESDLADLGALEHYGTGKARFTSVKIFTMDISGYIKQNFYSGDNIQIQLGIYAIEDIKGANVAIVIYDAYGYRVVDANTAMHGDYLYLNAGERARVHFQLEKVLLRPGQYLLGLWMGRGGIENIDGIKYVTSFFVEGRPEMIKNTEIFPGIYQCQFDYKIETISS